MILITIILNYIKHLINKFLYLEKGKGSTSPPFEKRTFKKVKIQFYYFIIILVFMIFIRYICVNNTIIQY